MDKKHALPTITFIGGDTRSIDVDVHTHLTQAELYGLSAKLVISDYVNFGGAPLYAQDGQVLQDGDAEYFHFFLSEEDTIQWRGKYLYQVTIRDESNNTEVYQGFMIVHGNADQINFGGKL